MGEFCSEILEGSPEWIDQEWERMEREHPTQTIKNASLNGCSDSDLMRKEKEKKQEKKEKENGRIVPEH